MESAILWLLLPLLLVVAAGLACLPLAWPRLRLWDHRFPILLAAMIFALQTKVPDFGPINPLNLALGLFVGLWWLEKLANPRTGRTASAFGVLVLLFFVCALASLFERLTPRLLWDLALLVVRLFMAVAVADVIRDRGMARLALNAFLISCALSAVAGIVQTSLFLGWGIDWSVVRTSDPRYTSALGFQMLRASGFLPMPHAFADALVLACIISVGLATSPAGRGRRGRLIVLALLSATAVGLSFARGEWLALALGVCALPLLGKPSRRLRWGVAAGLVLILGMGTGLLPRALSRLDVSSDSITDRVVLFRAGIETLGEHPWNGVGLRNFGPYSPTFERYPVHNAPLQVGSELGLPGLLVFAVLVLRAGLRLALALRASRDPVEAAELRALLGAYLGMLVAFQSSPMAYSEIVWFYLAFSEAVTRIYAGEPGLARSSPQPVPA